MKISEGNTRLKTLIEDTLLLLVKNGIEFEHEYSLDALVVFTVDKKDTFHVSLNEKFARKLQTEEPKKIDTRKRRANDTDLKQMSPKIKVEEDKSASVNAKTSGGKKPIKIESSPDSSPEPVTTRISTRSSHKLTAQSTRISTRSSSSKDSPSRKPTTPVKKPKVEKIETKANTSAKRASLEKSGGNKATPQNTVNSVNEESKSKETKSDDVEDTDDTDFCLVLENSDDDADVIEVKPTKPDVTCQSVSIDTRGSIHIVKTPVVFKKYGPDQPIRRARNDRPVNPPIVSSCSPGFQQVNVGSAKKQASSRKMLIPKPVHQLVVKKGLEVVDLNVESEGVAHGADAGAVCAAELSPRSLNTVMTNVIYTLNEPHKLKGQAGDIKINVGLPNRQGVVVQRSCLQCKIVFGSHEESTAHDCSASEPRTGVLYSCEQCRAIFMKVENLERHRLENHAAAHDA